MKQCKPLMKGWRGFKASLALFGVGLVGFSAHAVQIESASPKAGIDAVGAKVRAAVINDGAIKGDSDWNVGLNRVLLEMKITPVSGVPIYLYTEMDAHQLADEYINPKKKDGSSFDDTKSESLLRTLTLNYAPEGSILAAAIGNGQKPFADGSSLEKGNDVFTHVALSDKYTDLGYGALFQLNLKPRNGTKIELAVFPSGSSAVDTSGGFKSSQITPLSETSIKDENLSGAIKLTQQLGGSVEIAGSYAKVREAGTDQDRIAVSATYTHEIPEALQHAIGSWMTSTMIEYVKVLDNASDPDVVKLLARASKGKNAIYLRFERLMEDHATNGAALGYEREIVRNQLMQASLFGELFLTDEQGKPLNLGIAAGTNIRFGSYKDEMNADVKTRSRI